MSDPLRVRRDGSVWTLTIDRAERRNALDDATIDAMRTVLDEAECSPAVRSIVICGAGTVAFCAGSDLKAAREMDRAGRIAHTARGQRLVQQIEQHPCLILAAIEGYALGGGFELALACDLRVVGEGAEFGLPEVTKGMLPGWGGTYRLTQAIGLARAQSILLGGQRLTAEQANAAGLVTKVVPTGEAITQAVSLAAELAVSSDRETYARAKSLLRAGVYANGDTGRLMELLGETAQAGGEHYAAHVGRVEKASP